MKLRTGIWIGTGLLGLSGLILAGWIIVNRQTPAVPQSPAERPAQVTCQTIQQREVHRTLEVIGRIEPRAEIHLAVEHPGVIVDVAVDKGQPVRRDDLLLRQDNRLARTAVEEANLSLVEAERDLARQQDLLKSGAISIRDFQGVETRTQLARVLRDRAEILLSKRELRSPADAWIEARFVEAGDFAREGDPAFRLIDISEVKVVFDIPERDVVQVQSGRVFQVRVDALPGSLFEGPLSFLSAQAARENSSFTAEVSLTNPQGALRPGMLARVAIDLGVLHGAVSIPVQALVPQRGENVVFVVRDGLAERRIVRIAEFGVDEAVVTSGVQSGEILIVEGQRRLSDGQPVQSGKPGTDPASGNPQ
jgi:membrane fusion protein (multidrug efflux system)